LIEMEPRDAIPPHLAAGLADDAVTRIARAWQELRLLSRHGPCRNCERLHGVLVELRRAQELQAVSPDADRLLAAIQEVRQPPELHPPLGCRPCNTERALIDAGQGLPDERITFGAVKGRDPRAS
jgi:hypothetical protein